MQTHDGEETRPLGGIDGPIFVGLKYLFRAYSRAHMAGTDVWEYAVEIAELEQAGLYRSELRWLVLQGYADHAEEVTRPGSLQREFRTLDPHRFTSQTCFVLTDRGIRLFERHADPLKVRSLDVTPDPVSNGPGNGHLASSLPLLPSWDPQRRELRVGHLLVKRFRQPAGNQELILIAFEEEGWPWRIDDPLPTLHGQDPRVRLHDAIKCLNRNQVHRLLRFRGDGTGEGVTWEFIRRSRTPGE